ncbi:glycosyltransferase family 4 protein [Tamlana agarivorans]|uniref:Glycosyltransferase family 4 protein n=1 Tax=Pseudotamlana agarivorans TaxID=481183 RepID=A0ACC5U5Q6_9FLAO|nr:glycosyltransferase family 4 protein [Tamlana agarivorans]MBU2949619.1 glycosyltransferase family 4 protein [Tamlana agarivorans]
MNKILVIGPFPNPTTGVSLANKVVFEGLNDMKQFSIDSINTSFNKFEENIGVFSVSKALFYLKLNFRAYKIFGADMVYITPGQTFFGVMKYAVFIILASLFKRDIVIHVHGNYLGKEYRLIKGLKKTVFKWILDKTNKGIVLSESLRGNMSPFVDGDHIFVLYNFVEDYLFLNEEDIFKDENNIKPKIFFLSNLMEEKGILDLLEALKILEKKGVEFEAKIAGNIDAQNKSKIETYFNELNQVSYCGVVSGQAKKELLIWGNVFVLPTYYEMEGQPISILEAMATGNLVLTTNHSGIPDIFKDEVNGFYVEKKNPGSIVSKIEMIANHPDNFLGIRKYNFSIALKNYRVDNFISNLVNIIKI